MRTSDIIISQQSHRNIKKQIKFKAKIIDYIFLHLIIPLTFFGFFCYVSSSCGNINTFLCDPDIILIADLIFISSLFYYYRLTRDNKYSPDIFFFILLPIIILYSLYYALLKYHEICPGKGMETSYLICLISLGIAILLAVFIAIYSYNNLKQQVQGH